MWSCEICKKAKVDDKGFRLFISYDVVSVNQFYDTYPVEKIPIPMKCNQQIRICPKCLKKTDKNNKITL